MAQVGLQVSRLKTHCCKYTFLVVQVSCQVYSKRVSLNTLAEEAECTLKWAGQGAPILATVSVGRVPLQVSCYYGIDFAHFLGIVSVILSK